MGIEKIRIGKEAKDTSQNCDVHFTLPRGGAVLEEGVKVHVGQQLATVHARLDGPETAKDSDLNEA